MSANMKRKGARRHAAAMIAALGEGWEDSCYRREGCGSGHWVPVAINWTRGLRVVKEMEAPQDARYLVRFTAADAHLDNIRDDLQVLTDPHGRGWGRVAFFAQGRTPAAAIARLIREAKEREAEVHDAVMAVISDAEAEP